MRERAVESRGERLPLQCCGWRRPCQKLAKRQEGWEHGCDGRKLNKVELERECHAEGVGTSLKQEWKRHLGTPGAQWETRLLLGLHSLLLPSTQKDLLPL